MGNGVAAAGAASRTRRVVAAAHWLDANAERIVMIPLYAFIALLIGGEGILRYLTGTQTQWGGTAAIQAFIFLSWIGCAYHVRHRSHLRFDAVRKRLPSGLQRTACAFDDLVWLTVAGIVIYHSWQLVLMQQVYGSTVEGTDSVPLWIATATVPAAWLLIAVRAIQDIVLVARERS